MNLKLRLSNFELINKVFLKINLLKLFSDYSEVGNILEGIVEFINVKTASIKLYWQLRKIFNFKSI